VLSQGGEEEAPAEPVAEAAPEIPVDGADVESDDDSVAEAG
jgi:hypothetical protein